MIAETIVMRARLRRPSLLMPFCILACVMAVWIAGVVLAAAGIVRATGVMPGAGGAVFLILLVAYARLTRLTIDADGVELTQPFSSRRARWDDVVSLMVRSYLEPTHRGGVASGLRLRLAGQDRPFDIPDLFMEKRDLAALISARWTAHRAAVAAIGR